ncbi:hypothetical protein FH972_018378 [Carpinus fangiana]|uniref:Uncharacterized protein n=1 Tax=Carpinus fangiana TaxID=176857 RepID=A0A5N6RLR9_9ROSI|nr:hypothetical protein FH972_018378 [Carpinus fangiana]
MAVAFPCSQRERNRGIISPRTSTDKMKARRKPFSDKLKTNQRFRTRNAQYPLSPTRNKTENPDEEHLWVKR